MRSSADSVRQGAARRPANAAQCLRARSAESALRWGGRAPSFSIFKNRVGACSGWVIDVGEVRDGRFGVIQRRNELEALEGWSRTSKDHNGRRERGKNGADGDKVNVELMNSDRLVMEGHSKGR